jgi:uncharacterized membrane protein
LKTAQTVVLLIATITMGLMAGVFGLYAHAIMRGLHTVDDRTFVGSFQAIDRAIVNPLFLLTFLGALAGSATATALLFPADRRSVFPWVVVATGLYLIAVAITFIVHLPLNDDIKAAGDPSRIDVAAVRLAFHEGRWVAWNVVRAVTTTAAFVCLAWALVRFGGLAADRV